MNAVPRSILESVKRTRYGAIQNVNTNLIDWLPVDGAPGNYIKVMTIDEQAHRVDFLFKQDPHGEFPKHNHNCTAIAYTLGGLWGYREGDELMFEGCFSYEPAGTIHTPYSTEKGMLVYASFQGFSDGPFLHILDDQNRTVAELGVDFFKAHFRD
jgi:hypothetical protein